MYIILIETSGNQRYIFSTNKLRENIGASELIYQIGTKVVLESVGKTFTDTQNLQKFLLNEGENPPIEKQGNDGVEVIIATSGKALLLTKTPEKAKEIVSFVTKKALIEMPGLTVHGAIVEVKDDLTDIHSAVGEVHRKLENIRYQMPSSQQRFQRLPFVESCATSGLPAEKIKKFEPQAKAYSKLAISKRTVLTKKGEKGKFEKGRITKLLETIFEVDLPKNLEDFEEVFPETKWLSVIHADGNGLGEIYLKFDEHLKIERNQDEKKTFKIKEDGRKYVDAYRKFSIALDICTINATGYAIKELQIEVTKSKSLGEVPIIPLILGGDDLTVLCDGEYAIKFTKDFLEQFERETESLNNTEELKELGKDTAFKEIVEKLKIENNNEQRNIIPTIAENAFGVPRLGICAGIAIIKPHYPFHQAYGLAENLIKSAKLVKTKIKREYSGKKDVQIPCSAMDFHVLYDSSGVELKEIREKLIVDDGKTYLYAKPYIVSNLTEKPDNKTWMEKRVWKEFQSRVCAMIAKDDEGKNKLPNSQLHHIRESLFRGRKETDSEVNLFGHRYKDKGFGKLLCEKTVKNENGEDKKEYSLFFDEKHKKDGKEFDGHTTHFLDALDVVELWKGFECPEKNGETAAEVKDEQ